MEFGNKSATRNLFTSSNYATWTLPMTSKLQEMGIWELITGVYKIYEKKSTEEIERIRKLNVQAYVMLIQNLDTNNLGFFAQLCPKLNSVPHPCASWGEKRFQILQGGMRWHVGMGGVWVACPWSSQFFFSLSFWIDFELADILVQ